MKRFRQNIMKLATSRAVTPCVLGAFLLLYVGIAFGSNEPLTTLMAFTRRSFPLVALLALVPLNGAARLVRESAGVVRRRRAVLGGDGNSGSAGNSENSGKAEKAEKAEKSGNADSSLRGLFDEVVVLRGATGLHGVAEGLKAAGYSTRASETSLAAWRGLSLFPSRFLFLLANILLFGGIILSLTGRVSHREPVLEGEPLPASRDLVQRITLREEPGLLLARSLDIAVVREGGGERHFRLYPPATHRGHYLYPRYLGVAPLLRFSAPDVPAGFEQFAVLSIYPPGKEDSVRIPDSPYRFIFQMAPGDGADPYASGRITLQFRLLKGETLVFTGSAPVGGEVTGNGYRVALPEFRRMVVTDFVRDAGVPLIWAAAALFLLSLCCYLPVRIWFPRREILLRLSSGTVTACSRAEGGRRAHAGCFHELLDRLQPSQGRKP